MTATPLIVSTRTLRVIHRVGQIALLFLLSTAFSACPGRRAAGPDQTDRDLLLAAARRFGVSADPARVSARIAELERDPVLADSLYPGLAPPAMADRAREDLDIDAYLDRMIRNRVHISDLEMERYMAAHPEEGYAGKSLIDVRDRLYPYMRDQQARAAIEIHLRKLRSGDWRMTPT